MSVASQFHPGRGQKNILRKMIAILAVSAMVLSGLLVMTESGSTSSAASTAATTDTAYQTQIIYDIGDSGLTGDTTYNTYTASGTTRSVTYYGNAISTEYNPQVWDYTVSGQSVYWNAIKSYTANQTVVFTGWVYGNYDSSTGNVTYGSTTYEPGDVLVYKNGNWYIGETSTTITPETESDGSHTIYVKATWDTINRCEQIKSGGTNYSNAGGSAYTNFHILTGSMTISGSSSLLNNATIRSSNLASPVTVTISSGTSCSGMTIIDQVVFSLSAASTKDNHGNMSGFSANGNHLILGDGIQNDFNDSGSQYYNGNLFAGSETGTVSSTKLIIHSGMYSNVSAAGISGSVSNDAVLILNGATVIDTVLGGASAGGTVSGSAYIYATGLEMYGDYWEEHQYDSSYTGYVDYNGTTIQAAESTIFTGGSNNGYVKESHVYLSNDSVVWDIQGAGRRASSSMDTANIEVSGKAIVKHALCGSITDGNYNSGNKDCVKDVNLYVKGDAQVAGVFGAGYDTFYYATYTSMYNGGDINIEISGGTVGYVYGGGYRGTIGTSSNPIDSITITVSGGTILGDVFGGGRGGVDKTCHNVSTGANSWSDAAGDFTGYSLVYVKTVSINVTGGTVKGNVYGGGESIPHLTGYSNVGNSDAGIRDNVASLEATNGVHITVTSGATIENNVYGAGKGIDTSSNYVPYIYTIKDSEIVTIPWLGGNTGTNYMDTSTSAKTAYLTYAQVTGDVTISIESGAIVNNNVYGGGALGLTDGSTTISVAGTVENNVYGGGAGTLTGSSTRLGEVTTVGSITVSGTVNGNVYGGGAYGNVTSTSEIEVTISGEVKGNVYGGGSGRSTVEGGYSTDYGYVAGSASVTVSGKVDSDVYGGGAYGVVSGTTEVTLTGTALGKVCGGGFGILGETSNGSASVIINGGTVGSESAESNVYGGAENGITDGNTSVALTDATVYGNVFGSGKGDNNDSTKIAYTSTTGNVTVTISGGSISGNIYGGSALGLVKGNISLDISDIALGDTVYAGGMGETGIISVNGTRYLHIHGNTVINSSIYGGSALGNDSNSDENSNAIIYIENGTVKGSVFGGGFQGSTYGDVYILIGKNAPNCSEGTSFSGTVIPSDEGSSSVTIKESIYIGGDVGSAVSSETAYTEYMVQGDGELCINGTTDDANTVTITLNGSIMGSGNSCLTRGETTIHVIGVTEPDMESFHRATSVTIEDSTLVLAGRATIDETKSALIMDSYFSFYKIDSLVLKDCSTVTVNSAVENIGAYASLNSNGDATQKYSPFNKLIIGNGNTLSFRTLSGSTVTYSLVSGYTVISNSGSSAGYGGYVTGSTSSTGGFVVTDSGSYTVADCSDLDDECRCWFISGTINNEITMTVGSSAAEAVVSMTSLQNGTVYRYTGGTFITNSHVEGWEMVSSATISDKQFYVYFGYGTGEGVLNFNNGTYLEDYTENITPVNGTFTGDTKCPSMYISVAGKFDGSKYIGYTLLYINECRQVSYVDDGGTTCYTYIVVNSIQTKINIYSNTADESDEATITIGTVDGNGTGELLIPAGYPGYDVEITEVSSKSANATATKLYLQSSKNGDNTLGWTDSLGELAFYVNNTVHTGTVGNLQGGYMATLLFSVRDFAGAEQEEYSVTLKISNGSTINYLYVTIIIEAVPDVEVVFNGIVSGNTTVSLAYSFHYGATITEADCPPAGDNFVGWYTDKDCNNPFSYTTPLTKDSMNLWALYMYEITFDYMDGTTSVMYVPMIEGQNYIGSVDAPVRDGYDFMGWFTDTDFSLRWDTVKNQVKESMTLYAYWVGKSVTVHFSYTLDDGAHFTDLGTGVTGTVTYGGKFDTKNDDDEYILDAAQTALEAAMTEKSVDVKFIYWVYEENYADAEDKAYAIYTSSYLNDYSKVIVTGDSYDVYLTAFLCDTAVKVFMDATVYDEDTGVSLDLNADVDPPAEFLAFPDETVSTKTYGNNGTATVGNFNTSAVDYITITVNNSKDRTYYVHYSGNCTYLDGTTGSLSYNGSEIAIAAKVSDASIDVDLQNLSGTKYIKTIDSLTFTVYSTSGNVSSSATVDSNYTTSNKTVTLYLEVSGTAISSAGNTIDLSTAYYELSSTGTANFTISSEASSYKNVSGIAYKVTDSNNGTGNEYTGFTVTPTIPQTETNYFHFTIQLNGATRPGYSLTGWTINAETSKFISGNGYLFLAGGDIGVTVAKYTGGSFSYSAKFSVSVNGVDTVVAEVGLTDDDYEYIIGNYAPACYVFMFMSHWEHIPYTITISDSENGTIYAMYKDGDGNYVRFTETTMYYGESFNLVFYADDGFRFYQWKASGEGVIDDDMSESTTFIVQGDTVISANVVGPQIVTVIVTYDSYADLTDKTNVPDLVISSDGTTADFTFTKKAGVLADGMYTVEYTGMANLGSHSIYLVGPTTGKLYDMGITIVSTSAENVYRIDTTTSVTSENYDKTFTGVVALVCNGVDPYDGMLDLTEFLLQYVIYDSADSHHDASSDSTCIKMQLDGGYYTYYDGDETAVIASGKDPTVSTTIATYVHGSSDLSVLDIVGHIDQNKHQIKIKYTYGTTWTVTETLDKTIGYGDTYWDYIGSITGYTHDGSDYSVSHWYFDGTPTAYISSTDVCTVTEDGAITIVAELSPISDNYVTLHIMLQDVDGAGYTENAEKTAYTLDSSGSISYQLETVDGFVFATPEYGSITSSGLFTMTWTENIDVDVYLDRMKVNISVYKDGVGTQYSDILYGAYIELSKPENTPSTSYGSWVITGGLSGKVSDDAYVVTLSDVQNYTSTSDYRISIDGQTRTYTVSVMTTNGTVSETIDGADAGSTVIAKVTVDAGTAITGAKSGENYTISFRPTSEGSLYGFSVSDIDGYTCDGWDLVGVGETYSVYSDTTIVAKWTSIPYRVNIYYDGYTDDTSSHNHIEGVTATVASSPASLSTGEGTTVGDVTYETCKYITGVNYGMWVRISIDIDANYTLDTSKLNIGTATKLGSLQSYVVNFLVDSSVIGADGKINLYLSTKYSGATIYLVMDGSTLMDGDEKVSFVGSIGSKLRILAVGTDSEHGVDYYAYQVLKASSYFDGWYDSNGTALYVEEYNGQWYYVIPNVPNTNMWIYAYSQEVTVTGVEAIYDGNTHSTSVTISRGDNTVIRTTQNFTSTDGTISGTEIDVTNVNDDTNGKKYNYTVTVEKVQYTEDGEATTFPVIDFDSGQRYKSFTGQVGVELLSATVYIIPTSMIIAISDLPTIDETVYHGYTVLGLTGSELENLTITGWDTLNTSGDSITLSEQTIGVYYNQLHFSYVYKGETITDETTGSALKICAPYGILTVNKTGYSSVTI